MWFFFFITVEIYCASFRTFPRWLPGTAILCNSFRQTWRNAAFPFTLHFVNWQLNTSILKKKQTKKHSDFTAFSHSVFEWIEWRCFNRSQNIIMQCFVAARVRRSLIYILKRHLKCDFFPEDMFLFHFIENRSSCEGARRCCVYWHFDHSFQYFLLPLRFLSHLRTVCVLGLFCSCNLK